MRGYAFDSGLGILREGYKSAAAALRADIERVKAEAAAYEASDEFIGERDDDGYVLWEQNQVLDMQRETAEEALMAFRRAYAIVLYHFWEREIRTFTESGASADHEKLVKRAGEKGFPIDARLNAVRDLANALKHNKGANLQASWPEVLTLHARTGQPRNWYDAIQPTDEHLTEAFEIIAGSGPQIWPNGKPFPRSMSES
jgi:hypothetical protein